MRGKKGSARLGRPTKRHSTLWVFYSGPRTAENPRGRYVENTGIPWTEDQGSAEWKKAEAVRAKKEREYANAREGIAPQVIPTRKTFLAFSDEERAHVEATCKPAWALRAKYHLNAVNERFGAWRPEEVTEAAISSYQGALIDSGLSAKTVKDRVTLLLAVLRRAKRAHAMLELPHVEHVTAKMQKAPRKVREYIEAPRIEAILSSLREAWPEFADFAEAFYLCGLRPWALGRIRLEMVRTVGGRKELHVPEALMKEDGDGRDHRIPVLGALGAIIERRTMEARSDSVLLFHNGSGRSLLGAETKQGLSERAGRAWRKACEEHGITGFEFYTLRACFETRAGLGGATDAQIKAAMAHANGQTDTYMLASLTGEAMKAAAKTAAQEREQTAPADVLEFRGAHTLAV